MFGFLKRWFCTTYRRVEHQVVKKTVENHMVWITDTFRAPQDIYVVYVDGPLQAFAVPKAIGDRVKVGRQVFTFADPAALDLIGGMLIKQPGEGVVDVNDS